MNDEPKRLLDEDPEGSASLLIRSALGDGAPPRLGAKDRIAEELGIARENVVTPLRRRRLAAWSAGAAILAAAAGAILFVSPHRQEIHEMPNTPAATIAATVAPAAAEPAPPSPSYAEPLPAATVMRPIATTMVKPLHSADAGAPSKIMNASPKGPVKF